jgi:site-specific DNA-adenine methylase
MERAQIQKFAREAAWQWSYSWNTFTNITSDKEGKFWRPKVRDAFVTRIGRIAKGQYDVTKFLLSDMFGSPMSRTAKKFLSCALRLFNKKNNFTEAYQQRLKFVTIESYDVLEVIRAYDGSDAFFYLDPPYISYDQGPYKHSWFSGKGIHSHFPEALDKSSAQGWLLHGRRSF